MRIAEFLSRRSRLLILLLFVAAIPAVLNGSKQAWDSTGNRVADWLPAEFEETRKLTWFASHFGSDEILMISWPGCTLNDPRLPRLADALLAPVPNPDGEGPPLFRIVFTTRGVLEKLTAPPLELSRAEALARLAGWLVGRDGRTSCALALVSEAGAADRRAAVDRVYEVAENACGLEHDEVIVAGSTVDGVAIDRISLAALLELNGASLLMCFLLTWLFLRSLKLAIVVSFSALFCQQLSMALVYYTGSQMDSILLMIPSLAYVLATSGAVHLVNYFGDAARWHGLPGAPLLAFRHALLPCSLAAATTAMGLMSLTVSKIVPIARFGFYGTLAVLSGLVIVLLLVPTALEQWPPRRWLARLEARDPNADGGRWRPLATRVVAHHGKILAVTVLVMAITAWAVGSVHATARLHDLLPPDSRVIRDYHWLETNIGPLVPVEVVLVVPKHSPATILERCQLVEEVRRAIEQIDEVGATITVGNFGPPVPRGDQEVGIAGLTRRVILQRRLEERRDDFIASGVLRESVEGELWRISVRVPAHAKLDYGRFMKRLRGQVSPHIDATERVPGVRAEYCGGVPLIQKAQEQLLTDLIESFLLAFVLIAVAMALLLRSPLAGVLSMIPNLLPCTVVFGMMGWLELKVEIGAVMTASVALGMAVDGTLHFVTWFRRGMGQGRTRHGAVTYAYSRCAKAMLQSSLICGLGLLVFGLSHFVPIRRFAWLMFALLGAALVADVVVTPALLASPLGRFFQPKRRSDDDAETDSS